MRTSADIDILIHEQDMEEAAKSISDKVWLIQKERTYHDALFEGKNVDLELHFSLKENMRGIYNIWVLEKKPR